MFKKLLCLCVVVGLGFGIMGTLGCSNAPPQTPKKELPAEKPEAQAVEMKLPADK